VIKIVLKKKFKTNDMVTTLPCFHIFHQQEAEQWLNKQPVCPICRHSIFDCGENLHYDRKSSIGRHHPSRSFDSASSISSNTNLSGVF